MSLANNSKPYRLPSAVLATPAQEPYPVAACPQEAMLNSVNVLIKGVQDRIGDVINRVRERSDYLTGSAPTAAGQSPPSPSPEGSVPVAIYGLNIIGQQLNVLEDEVGRLFKL